MTMRITEKHLHGLVDRLNGITNQPAQMTDGRTNPGAFALSFAYGGACLVRFTSQQGSETDVFRTGHLPKRELYEKLTAYIDGLLAGIHLTEREGREDYRVTIEQGAAVGEYLESAKSAKLAEIAAFKKFNQEYPTRENGEVTRTELVGGGAL